MGLVRQLWQSATSSCQLETQERLSLKHKEPLMTLIQFSRCSTHSQLQRPAYSKTFPAQTSNNKTLQCSRYQNKLVINASHISRESYHHPCCLLINNFQFRFSLMINLIILGPLQKFPDDTIWWQNPSITRFLMRNYTDVMRESGTVYRLSVDLCHHVSSCFSFWGKDKLIHFTYSYNYFCSSPSSMPSLSVISSQAWVSIPEDMTPISGVCRWGLGTILDSLQFSKLRLRN